MTTVPVVVVVALAVVAAKETAQPTLEELAVLD
jgi:hypothetical protein